MKVNAVSDTDTSNLQTNNVTTDSNEEFSSYLNVDSSLDAIFEKASETYGVSKSLLEAIAKQESDFDPNATSHCGAQGLMQLMPSTAAGLGVTNAYDPEQNVMGGAQYISGLLSQYNGNVQLALAAYNAGSNNVAKYGGIPPFEETQNYVVKVMGYYTNGVDVPDVSYSTSSATGTSDSTSDEQSAFLDQIFSYDDYLDFLNIYMSQQQQDEEENNSDDDSNSGTQAALSTAYAFQEIHYNNSVMNLLKSVEV